ncbi:hypothetical protein PRIPAC_80600 [Pristionchus pacificus]|uniref:Uncharacterized protein n=1 Tax=Pristionchus pacificus TaxID=54126 RepID=A0A2A6BE29_PRIPA|nr:hypothetical protein PRIPAC_80600 [Pristionchus pacificus]|eukprot:PDM64160.1 hypothetical protein PRIPAC_54404 [Pristionchus pacificus]
MTPRLRYKFRDERPLEKNWRDWVAVWRDDGNSYEQIIQLLAQKGYHTTKSTVKRILEKEFIPREYHPVSIKDMEIFSNIRDSVIRSYLDDSEATISTSQKSILNDFGEEISLNVVRRIREECGFKCYNTRYGHSVRLVNRPLRLAFCLEQIALDNQFVNHIFTDERCVQLSANNRFVFCLRGDVERRVKSIHKNPVKVMIWGGINWRGPTPLVMFHSGTKINNGVYQGVLESAYKDWARENFGETASIDAAKQHISFAEHFKRTIMPLLILQQELRTISRGRDFRIQTQMRKVVKSEGVPVHD